MAKKIKVTAIDDIDGSPASETVSFSFDGRSYEIDLSARNATRLRKMLEPYIESGRQAAVQKRPHTGSRQRSTEIRSRTKAHGLQVSERGRIPVEVVETYGTGGSRVIANTGVSPGPDFDDDDDE